MATYLGKLIELKPSPIWIIGFIQFIFGLSVLFNHEQNAGVVGHLPVGQWLTWQVVMGWLFVCAVLTICIKPVWLKYLATTGFVPYLLASLDYAILNNSAQAPMVYASLWLCFIHIVFLVLELRRWGS